MLLRVVWTCEVVGLGGGRRGECELQFLLCGRLQLPLQKGICHSPPAPQTMGTWLGKGLSCFSGVFSFEGGRINWESVSGENVFADQTEECGAK